MHILFDYASTFKVKHSYNFFLDSRSCVLKRASQARLSILNLIEICIAADYEFEHRKVSNDFLGYFQMKIE